MDEKRAIIPSDSEVRVSAENLWIRYENAILLFHGENRDETADIYERIVKSGFENCSTVSDGDMWRGFVLGYLSAPMEQDETKGLSAETVNKLWDLEHKAFHQIEALKDTIFSVEKLLIELSKQEG